MGEDLPKLSPFAPVKLTVLLVLEKGEKSNCTVKSVSPSLDLEEPKN